MNVNHYDNYIKCGEILKAPTINEKDQYILKCVECEDHYYLLESFVFPCSSHSSQGHVVADEEHDSIKFEDLDSDEGDPLNLIEDDNTNTDNEIVNIKEEHLLQESEEHIDTISNDVVDQSLEIVEQLTDYSDEVNCESLESDDASIEWEDSKSDSFVHNFMKSKQNVTSLIEAYKNQPILWNRKHPQFRLNEQHPKYLGNVRKELKEEINLKISCSQVAAVIKYLCQKYSEYLKSYEDNVEMIKNQNRPVWFIKQLEFLKPEISTTELNCLQSELMPEQMNQVLAIYQRFPHLWNTNLIENCCRNKRQEALSQMLQVIDSEMGLSITENALKKYLHFIHKRFTKEKRRNIRSNDTKSKGSMENYKHMMFLYDHVGPFKCSECDVELRNPLYFKVHKSQHDGSVPLKCSMCNKEFKILRTYTLHARRHMDDLEEECKECGKKFINTCELNIHMRFHTGAKPYCCEICGVSFRHIQTFTSHKRRHEKQYLHKCPICSKGFYSKAKMDDHIRSHKQIREFMCKTCGKAFITKKTLQQHQVTHEDVRKHACTLCGKSFKLKVGVTQHMKTHGSQIYERPDDLV